MNFVEAVSHVFLNYAHFSGRARRSEYWNFVLFNILVQVLLSLLATLLLGADITVPLGERYVFGVSLVSLVVALALFLPSLAVTVRRLHDTGRPGIYFLFVLIPLVGPILMLVWLCQDSQPTANAYGPCPKDASGIAAEQPSTPHEVNPATRYGIVCVEGALQGQACPLQGESVLFGRDPACTVKFPPSAPGISARHCQVDRQGDKVTITDLDSTYGTFVADGRKLGPRQPASLRVGDQFWLGSHDNRFELVVYSS